MKKPARLFLGWGGVALVGLFSVALALGLSAKSHEPLVAAHEHAVRGGTGVAPSNSPTSTETGITFDTEMAQVNARMHQAMQVTPTGDPDRDFIRMMIPHHQGAIDMALVLLKYGNDKRLKRLAQSIIVEQGQEITYLHMLLDAAPAEQVPPHQ
jgi:Domain of unknown function (DUF305)